MSEKTTPRRSAKKSGATGNGALATAWGADLTGMLCPACEWAFLGPSKVRDIPCPHCHKQTLTPLGEGWGDLPAARPPERLLPFSTDAQAIAVGIQGFAKRIPFAPLDLNPQTLQERLQPLFLPMWLVDASVRAEWQAEAGFDYQVVSHEDRYAGGGWSEHEVTETRTRWEPRLGRLTRAYENVPAPALEEHAALAKALGDFDLSASQPYQAADLGAAFVRLADRPPQDAWPAAVPVIQRQAAEECRKACGADRLRAFRWSPQYETQAWTQLLLPVYASYYLDDEKTPRSVLIHGQSGRLHGERRASMRRARQLAAALGGAAVGLGGGGFIAALLSGVLPALLLVGVLGIVVGAILLLSAIAPLAVVSQFNRSQELRAQRENRVAATAT